MRILFAAENKQFLKYLERLFRYVRVQGSNVQGGIVPATVNRRADYVYNALPRWMHACLVEPHQGQDVDTVRSFAEVRHKDKPVTKVTIQPPHFGTKEVRADASDDEFEAAIACTSHYHHADVEKTDAYFMMRAALVAVARVRRDQALDVLVVPCLGAVSPDTARSMYAAISEFFKLQ